jgi:putative ABC transport system permease protein
LWFKIKLGFFTLKISDVAAKINCITDWTKLTKDFIRLVLLVSLIAFPIAWWVMSNWLKNYQYRIEISLWM